MGEITDLTDHYVPSVAVALEEPTHIVTVNYKINGIYEICLHVDNSTLVALEIDDNYLVRYLQENLKKSGFKEPVTSIQKLSLSTQNQNARICTTIEEVILAHTDPNCSSNWEIDDELLIRLVSERAPLYDNQTVPQEQRTKAVRDGLWAEIKRIMNVDLPIERLCKRWGQLRNYYSKIKERKKKTDGFVSLEKYNSDLEPPKWKHYDSMRFLDAIQEKQIEQYNKLVNDDGEKMDNGKKRNKYLILADCKVGRMLVKNAYRYFVKNRVKNKTPVQATAECLNICKRSVLKYKNEDLSTVKKITRKRARKCTDDIGEDIKEEIRNIVNNMKMENKPITLKAVWKIMRAREIYKYSETSVYRLIKSMGLFSNQQKTKKVKDLSQADATKKSPTKTFFN